MIAPARRHLSGLWLGLFYTVRERRCKPLQRRERARDGLRSSRPGGPASEPPVDEAELQRRLEEQLRRLRVEDLILESVASILNLSARRIAKEDERDLEQARVGIEAVRALLELIEPNARAQVQEALSQVQVLYAREAQGGGGQPGSGAAPGGGGPPALPRRSPPRSRGSSAPGGLWTPPGA